MREERSEFQPAAVWTIKAELPVNKGLQIVRRGTIRLTITDRTNQFRLHGILDLMQLGPVATIARLAAVVLHGLKQT